MRDRRPNLLLFLSCTASLTLHLAALALSGSVSTVPQQAVQDSITLRIEHPSQQTRAPQNPPRAAASTAPHAAAPANHQNTPPESTPGGITLAASAIPYPREGIDMALISDQASGNARFQISVGKDGQVLDCRRLESSLNETETEALLQKILATLFIPAIQNGQAVAAETILEISFGNSKETPEQIPTALAGKF